MVFWKSLDGMLTVEFTSPDPEKTLDFIVRSQISISNIIQISELTYQIQMQRSDYKRILQILNYEEYNLKIIGKKGLFWLLTSLVHRPVLLLLLSIPLILSLYIPSRIFFITVDGNATLPEQLILSAAEDCGIHFAASRRYVRSEKVKNELLSSVPQLQWAGINTAGCRAVISVRERTKEEPEKDSMIVSNLIADRDGYILSSTITSGSAHFVPGQAVTKGQILISGYTDCGSFVRATRAVGEIYAQTNREIMAIMPQTYLVPEGTGKVKKKISMLIGKKRINLWKDSRICDASCGRMYEEYYFSLPGDFQLPIAICIDQYKDYELQEATVTEQEAQMQLQNFSRAYVLREMIAGRILQEHSQLSNDDLYTLESSYTCTEIIGKEQRERIGVINGKGN